MDQEECPQLERLAVAHQLPAAKDNGIIDDDEDAGLLQGGHGCAARYELKVVGGIASDGLEGLAEDWP